jgi:hypothetical protein
VRPSSDAGAEDATSPEALAPAAKAHRLIFEWVRKLAEGSAEVPRNTMPLMVMYAQVAMQQQLDKAHTARSEQVATRHRLARRAWPPPSSRCSQRARTCALIIDAFSGRFLSASQAHRRGDDAIRSRLKVVTRSVRVAVFVGTLSSSDPMRTEVCGSTTLTAGGNTIVRS